MAAQELPEMPNGPIMELFGQRKRFHVPHGLKPLLEELTREVLRYQPEDINVFLTQYVDTKIAKQKAADQKPKRKSWEWRTWSSDGPSQLDEKELTEFLGELHVTKDDANRYATKIQAAFRGHEARKSLTGKIGRKSTKDPENSEGEKSTRKNGDNKKWSLEGPSILNETELNDLLTELNVTKEEANKYATKIQAAFRGHETRRSLTKEGKLPKRTSQSADEPPPQTKELETVTKESDKSIVSKKASSKDLIVAEKAAVSGPPSKKASTDLQQEVVINEEGPSSDAENLSAEDSPREGPADMQVIKLPDPPAAKGEGSPGEVSRQASKEAADI